MSKLTDRLEAIKIYNSHNFATRGEAVAWISYSTAHPHALGRTRPRAVVYYVVNGKQRYKEFQELVGGHVETRRASVEAAQKAASKRFGVTEWVRTPFHGEWAWVPREAYDRVLELLED